MKIRGAVLNAMGVEPPIDCGMPSDTALQMCKPRHEGGVCVP